jgi:hypothetical protein
MAQGEPEPNCPSLRAIGNNCYPVSTTSDRSFEPCGVQRQVQLRYSKQPGRSSALRSISNNAKARPIVGLSERVYESTKLAALFRHARRPGLPGRRNTENVNLSVEEVHSPKSRISLAELITTASAISSFCEPCRACCRRRRAVRVAREPNGVPAGRPEVGENVRVGRPILTASRIWPCPTLPPRCLSTSRCDDRLNLRGCFVSVLRPRPVVRQRGHHQDTDNADYDLHPDSAGNLDQHDMCSKG